MPASVTATDRKNLNPNIGRASRLMARSVLFDDVVEVFDLTDLDARLSFDIVDSDRRLVTPLLSIVIFSGAPFASSRARVLDKAMPPAYTTSNLIRAPLTRTTARCHPTS